MFRLDSALADQAKPRHGPSPSRSAPLRGSRVGEGLCRPLGDRLECEALRVIGSVPANPSKVPVIFLFAGLFIND